MRTFIAMEVPEDIRRKVDNFIKEEAKKNLPIKWVKFQNLHITLKFLGEIDEKKKEEIIPFLKDVGSTFTPFDIRFETIGCFPNLRNPRVVWIGVKQGNEQLTSIARTLEQILSRCGFKEERRFHAHLTIGRIKKFCKVDDILEKNIILEPFFVNEITLFKSTLKPEGPIYEALQKFTLG